MTYDPENDEWEHDGSHRGYGMLIIAVVIFGTIAGAALWFLPWPLP